MFAGELIKSLVKIPFSNGAILLISDLFKTNFERPTFFSGLFNPALNGEINSFLVPSYSKVVFTFIFIIINKLI